MATGSGKTIVMALVVAWSYFHRLRVPGSPLSRNFLIVAPNVIVYQRLERDFASNKIFEELPIVPPGWTLDLKPILRGDSAEPAPSGTLFLTNVQQIHQNRERQWTPENAVAALLGPPVAKDLASHERSMLERIRSLPDLVAINDEAHHVHDEDLEWAKTLLGLKDKLRLWLDFSATPKDQNGTYFPWIVCDYPLPQAVEDGIVKSPLIVQKVDRADPEKVTGENVVQAYAEWLHAAVTRHKEHAAAYGSLGLKPVLFVMAEKSDYADKIGEWLRKEKAFGFRPEEVLVIHTDTKGEITKGDLDQAREAAAAIDDPTSPVKVIVSVLMLREGWDVRAVTVVLGLRPFTAKAQILPEQAVGRGLRLMPRTEGIQTLEVMGTRAFEAFVQELEKEGLGVPVTKKPPVLPVKIEPIRERTVYDIAIPLTQPLFGHTYRRLMDLDPSTIGCLGDLPDVTAPPELRFVLEFLTTKSRVGELRLGYPMLVAEDAVGRLVDSAMTKAQLAGQFAELYPIIERYVTDCAFGFPVSLEDDNVRGALSNFVFRERLAGHIARKIGELTVRGEATRVRGPRLQALRGPAIPLAATAPSRDAHHFQLRHGLQRLREAVRRVPGYPTGHPPMGRARRAVHPVQRHVPRRDRGAQALLPRFCRSPVAWRPRRELDYRDEGPRLPGRRAQGHGHTHVVPHDARADRPGLALLPRRSARLRQGPTRDVRGVARGR